MATVHILGVLSVISFILYCHCGEPTFKVLNEVAMAGPYGVGCRRFRAPTGKNHVLALYPIKKENWTEDKFQLPYQLFG